MNFFQLFRWNGSCQIDLPQLFIIKKSTQCRSLHLLSPFLLATVERGFILVSGDISSSHTCVHGLSSFMDHSVPCMILACSHFTPTQVPCSLSYTLIIHNLNCLSGSVLIHSNTLQLIVCFLLLLQSHISEIVLYIPYSPFSPMTSDFYLLCHQLLQDHHWPSYL